MAINRKKLENLGYSERNNIFLHPEDRDFHRYLNLLDNEEATTLWDQYAFYNRSLLPYTTSFYEKQESYLILEGILKKVKTKGVLLELGSGDGRFANLLSRLAFDQIIFNDLHFTSLLNITEEISGKENVLSIAGDAFSIPIEDDSISVILAWSIFSLTNIDYSECLQHVFRLLKKGGICVVAEPLLHAHLVYSLVRGNIEEFKCALNTSTRAASIEKPNERYRLNSLEYYEGMIEKSPLKVIDKGGLSILPSLFFGGVYQEKEINENNLEEVSRMMVDSVLTQDNSGLIRQAYWVLQK